MNRKVVIVTGASQGIGRATAIRVAKDVGAVVLAARNEAGLNETAEAVRAAGAEALVIAADLSKPEAARQIVDAALARFGRIDGVANIAGAVPQIDLMEMSDEQWNAGMELKLHGARRLTIAAWPSLKASGGSVIFTSGNSAQTPKAGYAAVGTVNAAIVAMAKAFSDRGIEDGVTVNSVLPGPVMSGRRKSYLQHWAPKHDVSVEAAERKFLKVAGIERYGQPEEIAELMAFLLSPAARWMQGSAIRMDGGEIKSV